MEHSGWHTYPKVLPDLQQLALLNVHSRFVLFQPEKRVVTFLPSACKLG